MNTSTLQNNDWPHSSDVVISINPAKRKQVMAGLAVLGLLGLFLLSGEPERMFREHQTKGETAALTPTMQKLAIEGKAEAAVWLAAQDPKHEGVRLDDLVKQKVPGAMYYQGLEKIKAGDKPAGVALIAQAAAEGYPAAVRYQIKSK